MLAIRMQRTGRKGHAMFRVIVQDSRRTPTSGKVIAQLGSYDPHAKTVTLNKEKASFYLDNGAQPSDRVAVLFKKEGVELPKWVSDPTKKESAVRNPDKRRSTRPEEPAEEAPAVEVEAAEATENPAEAAADQPAETPEAAEPTNENEAEQPKTEAPSEEPAAEPSAGEEAPEAASEEEVSSEKEAK